MVKKESKNKIQQDMKKRREKRIKRISEIEVNWDYEKYLTYENLLKAHKESRAAKLKRKDVILFNIRQEEYLLDLLEELTDGSYKHGGYSEFYIYEPKERKIEKSLYRDRIVHRWLVDNFLLPYYLPKFIYASFACIPGKGLHLSTLEVQKVMRICKRKWGEYYILKMDVRHYFESINRNKLLEILKRDIKEERMLWLLKEIIYSPREEMGLALGNYTSQLFANIYLNEIDQYVTKELGIKYYFRYMDDSCLMVKTKEEAKIALQKIEKFLKEKLFLELNDKTQIFKGKQGLNFCGYKINEYRLKIRDVGKKKLKKKVKKLIEKVKKGEMTSKEAQKYLAGHFGYMNIADVYNLTNKLFYRC